jgi:RHS repeat-associated protein
MTLPGDLSWELVYDVNEQLRAVKNPKSETYEYRYDRAGRVVESTSFDGRSTRYQQGKNGRITRAEYADGSHRAFSYDERGHLVGESSPHGARIFERNAMGQITRAIVEDHYGTVEVELEHDESGRIISTTSNGATIRYELDELKRRVARVLPGGETTRFSHDATGIAGIDHQGHKLWIQRDARGREVRKVLYDSGAEIVTSYDPLDRPAEQWVLAARGPGGGAPRVLVQRKWSYDPRHHVQRMLDRRWGAFDYSHDEAGRLVGAAGARTAERFDYDAAGSVIGSGGAEPWAMRAGNVLVRTPMAEYEVDERGRRIKKIALRDDRPSGEVTRYYWDCRDQLREVDLPDGRRVIYCYDAFGRRVRKEILPPRPDPALPPGPPRIIQYLWDGDTLASEVDSERGTRVFVLDQAHLVPLIHEEQGEVFVYTHDQVFTPKELIGEDGAVAWSAAHSPWGRVVAEEQPAGKSRARPLSSPFRLLGQYHDEETGLCYTRFRYFDPETVRWLSPDPIAMLGGMNLFAFNGNPTSTSDLLGLGPCAGYGWIKFHTDAHGRPVGVTAIVTKDMILMGQEPAGSIKPDGFGTLPGVNARGHLLANMLGGPGEGTPGTANLVTLRQSPTNHPGMTQQEWAVRNNVEANGPALYDVHVTYPPGSTTGVAPTSVTMQGYGNNGQGILVDPATGAPTSTVTIPN